LGHSFHPADLIDGMPPGVGGLQRQHVGYPLLLEPSLELAMLPVEDVAYHRPEGEVHLYRSLDQFHGYLGFGAKGRIVLAALEVVRRSVGLDLKRIVQSLVDPQARNGDHPVVYLADAAQVLLAYVRRGFAVLAVPGLVHYQRAARRRSSPRVFEHDLHPAPVYLLRAPARLGEEPLKTLRLFALCPHEGFGVGESGQGLVFRSVGSSSPSR
jgi:hypothetical protein